MKKNKTIHLTTAIIFALCVALSAAQDSDARQGKGFPGGHGGPNPFMRCIYKLNLSSDTLTKIEALLQAQQAAMTADRGSMKAAMNTYFAALTAAAPDSAALAQAKQAIIALEQKHAENRFALDSSIVALLSSDEAVQLGECLASAQPEPRSGDNETGRKHGRR